ncbi:MAG: OsmC family protein [candidate division WOR-3 bacterium]|nr:OsmC family protein [candidate division WOR-3 bacterium]
MITLTWCDGIRFEAEDRYGHKVIVDTEKEFGGSDQGFRPLELILVSLAGCMGMDIVAILQKKGGKIDNFVVEASGVRAEEHPHKYTKITLKFKCEGVYEREDLLRSFELSRDKYCSAVATLSSSPELEFVI